MSRPKKRTPAKGFFDYDTAMALARHKNKFVRCDEYMSPGWKIGRVVIRGTGPKPKYAPGLFCINPHTGSEYQFTAQAVDVNSVQWRLA